MADKPKELELPTVLYKLDEDEGGLYCKVKTEEEYDKAKADGFTDEPPKGWNNVPDPDTPGGTKPQKEIEITAIPAEQAEADERAARRSKKNGDTPPATSATLEGSVEDLKDALAKQTDAKLLQNLRSDEVKGKNRKGALDAIDARIEELKG